MKTIVGRHIEGISLNGIEWLLDDENKPIEFDSRTDAKNFLKENGYDDLTEDELEDCFVFEEK